MRTKIGPATLWTGAETLSDARKQIIWHVEPGHQYITALASMVKETTRHVTAEVVVNRSGGWTGPERGAWRPAAGDPHLAPFQCRSRLHVSSALHLLEQDDSLVAQCIRYATALNHERLCHDGTLMAGARLVR